MTYASEKVLLEIELDIRILLDDPEYLDCLFDDLMPHVSSFSYFAGSCYLRSNTVTCVYRVSSRARSSNGTTYRRVRQY